MISSLVMGLVSSSINRLSRGLDIGILLVDYWGQFRVPVTSHGTLNWRGISLIMKQSLNLGLNLEASFFLCVVSLARLSIATQQFRPIRIFVPTAKTSQATHGNARLALHNSCVSGHHIRPAIRVSGLLSFNWILLLDINGKEWSRWHVWWSGMVDEVGNQRSSTEEEN